MSRTLRVMSYNIKGLQLDERAVVDVIRAVDPDILGIQEPPRGPMRRRRLHALAASTDMRVVVGGYAARTTALLVTDRLLTDRPGAVTDARGKRLRWWGTRSRMRSFTRRGFATAEVDGVRVVVVHLSLDPVERARHVNRILAEVPLDVPDVSTVRDDVPGDVQGRESCGARFETGSPGPGHDRCIVMGDLNELPDGPVWDRLGTRLRDVAAHVPRPTFPAGRPKQRIDAVFVDPGITVLALRVVDDEPVTRASDHRPLVVDLALPDGRW